MKISWWYVLAVMIFTIIGALIYQVAFAQERYSIEEVRYSKQLSTHFSSAELACKCCGVYVENKELLFRLEMLRAKLGKPIIITSGYRCPRHNKEVGGVANSQHTKGTAVDIKVAGYTPAQVAQLAKQCGFTWTKVYSAWTHIDIRED